MTDFDEYLKRVTEAYMSKHNRWIKLMDIQAIRNELTDARNSQLLTDREYRVLYSLTELLEVKTKSLIDGGNTYERT